MTRRVEGSAGSDLRPLTVYLRPADAEKLIALAQREDRSVAAEIRQAVLKHLQKGEQ